MTDKEKTDSPNVEIVRRIHEALSHGQTVFGYCDCDEKDTPTRVLCGLVRGASFDSTVCNSIIYYLEDRETHLKVTRLGCKMTVVAINGTSAQVVACNGKLST